MAEADKVGCPFCNRKYKRPDKLTEHVEDTHPLGALEENNVEFSITGQRYLTAQVQRYIKVLDTFSQCETTNIDSWIQQYLDWNGVNPISKQVVFIWISHMLLPQLYANLTFSRPSELGNWFNIAELDPTLPLIEPKPLEEKGLLSPKEEGEKKEPAPRKGRRKKEGEKGEIAPSKGRRKKEPKGKEEEVVITLQEELKRMTLKHIAFCRTVRETGLLYKLQASVAQFKVILTEFKLFLNLGYAWNGDNFHPSAIIDCIWHAAMLNPGAYTTLSVSFVGKRLPHSLAHNETSQGDNNRYERFIRQFEHRYHRQPLQSADLTIVKGEPNIFEELIQQCLHQEEVARQQQKIKEEEEKKEKERREAEKREREKRLAEEQAVLHARWARQEQLEKQKAEKDREYEKIQIAHLMQVCGITEDQAYSKLHPNTGSSSCSC